MSPPKIIIDNKRILVKPLNITNPKNLIYINKNSKMKLMSPENSDIMKLQIQNMQKAQLNISREEVIYKSQPGDFLQGNTQTTISITNNLNLYNNSSTTAKYTCGDGIHFETSEEIIKLIGQRNYNTVFSGICSIIDQELKVKAILALLRTPNSIKRWSVECQTDSINLDGKQLVNQACQTAECCIDLLFKTKQRKRLRRQHQPYVILTDTERIAIKKRIIVHPKSFKMELSKCHSDNTTCSEPSLNSSLDVNTIKKEPDINTLETFASDSSKIYSDEDVTKQYPVKCESEGSNLLINSDCVNFEVNDEQILPDIKPFLNEVSNDGSIGNLSQLSGYSNEHLMNNPDKILCNVDEHTNNSMVELKMLDGTSVWVAQKPEDKFHIATAEILNSVQSPSDKKKLLWMQAYVDWKYCLERDSNGNLPIHNAVLNNDVDWVRRQCLVLKSRHESVDILSAGMSALHMSIYQNSACTGTLLQLGADVVLADEDHRTPLHLAAEGSASQLKLILMHCRERARNIISENEDLCMPGMEMKSDEELGQMLIDNLCQNYDSQGYTPLMLASKIGNYMNVELLAKASPTTMNVLMPNSGDTALYIAVGAACLDAVDFSVHAARKNIGEHFLKTVGVLIENGADPYKTNYSGSNVSDIMTDLRVPELSIVIANTMSSRNLKSNGISNDCSHLMLVKDREGKLDIEECSHLSAPCKLLKSSDKNEPSSKNGIGSKNNDETGTEKIKVGTNAKLNKEKPKILLDIPVKTVPSLFFLKNCVTVKPKDFIVNKDANLGKDAAKSNRIVIQKPFPAVNQSGNVSAKVSEKLEANKSNPNINAIVTVSKNPTIVHAVKPNRIVLKKPLITVSQLETNKKGVPILNKRRNAKSIFIRKTFTNPTKIPSNAVKVDSCDDGSDIMTSTLTVDSDIDRSTEVIMTSSPSTSTILKCDQTDEIHSNLENKDTDKSVADEPILTKKKKINILSRSGGKKMKFK